MSEATKMHRVARRLVPIGALLIAAVMVLQPATASAQQWTATLSGASEDPPNNSPGTGFVLVKVMDNQMDISVTFADLVSPSTVAHIHCCTAVPNAGNVGVASIVPTYPSFPVGVTSGMWSESFDLSDASSYNPAFINNNGGTALSARSALIDGLNAERAYFNLHSQQFPGGEIRGFLVATVPEPSTSAALLIGVLGLAATTLRRRTVTR